jgi:DNA-binding transcriptional ArsR family regulator
MHTASDALFKSLADPTRRAIFERLCGDANYGWQRFIGGLERLVARLDGT